jgi:predicted TIM-barrel fold metal-dependent hydrolase
MIAADYPIENAEEAGHFLDAVSIPDDLRADVAYNNAAKLLGL